MKDSRYNHGERHPDLQHNRQDQYDNEYMKRNRALGNSRYPTRSINNINENNFDDFNSYDDENTGKYENYNGGGYYGSNYGAINNNNTGRDWEQNAGYRDNYKRLTTGQWPEIERAEQQRKQHDQAGNHKGKGPRGYQRTDARILQDIHDVLSEDPYVDATNIEVQVENGEVILTGTVDDRNVKRRAEDLAESVSGIKHLENRLRTRRPGGETVNISNH